MSEEFLLPDLSTLSLSPKSLCPFDLAGDDIENGVHQVPIIVPGLSFVCNRLPFKHL